MREIVQISIGQFGNQVGEQFWHGMVAEHKMTLDGYQIEDQPQQLSTYFVEHKSGKYIPRSLQIDMVPDCLDKIQASDLYKLLNPDTFISSNQGSGGIFAKVVYDVGIPVLELVIEQLRFMIEQCDNFQGFQITQALSGGTGSGFMHLLSNKIYEVFSPKILQSFTLFPDNPSVMILEPYNSMLCLNQLVEYCSLTHLFDNKSLNLQCFYNAQKAGFVDSNRMIADSMLNTNCSDRFPGVLNGGLFKLQTNLVLFPRMHFVPHALIEFKHNKLENSLAQLYDIKNMRADFRHLDPNYFCGASLFRGNIAQSEIEIIEKQHHYCEWMPNTSMVAHCNNAGVNQTTQGMFFGNHMQLNKYLDHLQDAFTQMFRRKAFLYKYLEYGMDEMEFTEAESNANDLSSEYTFGNNMDIDFEEGEFE